MVVLSRPSVCLYRRLPPSSIRACRDFFSPSCGLLPEQNKQTKKQPCAPLLRHNIFLPFLLAMRWRCWREQELNRPASQPDRQTDRNTATLCCAKLTRFTPNPNRRMEDGGWQDEGSSRVWRGTSKEEKAMQNAPRTRLC